MKPPHAALFFLAAAAIAPVSGQTVFDENFTGTTADGWVFGGNYTPILTAAHGIDTPGDGWLRLTDNANNRATYAFLDEQIFSVNAKISVTMEYAFYNGSGADGITFFLVDGSMTADTFAPGAYGGSMGYAQGHGLDGMPGGYLGFAFDNYGNYSNPTEDRVGGPGFRPNSIAVRGPESNDYAYIAGATLDGYGQMDFPDSTSRPNQNGSGYRAFQLTLDANNQLEVFMKFGVNGTFQSVFTADLSAYDRPETFKLGFTGATGGNTEIHEIRNLQVVTTPWSSGSGAYEWDNGAGNNNWGSAAGGENNSNWFSDISGNNNKTPLRDSDVLFGNKPTSGPQTVNIANTVEVRNLTFDTAYDYTLSGSGTIRMGDTGKAGLPSINVNNYNDANARHKISTAIIVEEALRINNYSFSSLCLNGTLTTGGNTMTVNGYGAVNFNGDIRGSGDLVKNGNGITTINNNNSDGTAWTGNVIINQGVVVVTENGALGGSVSSTNNQNRSSGDTSIRMTNANAAAIGVKVGQLVTGSNIPAGTYITGISVSGGNTTITLSRALTGNLSNSATVSFSGVTTVNNGGSLAFRTGVNYTTAEHVFISGRGADLGDGRPVGAIYNDGGNNSFSGPITLTGNAAIGSREGTLTLSGVIGQSGNNRSLSKVGDGVVVLTNSGNSYTGATTVEGGVLRIAGSENALSGGFATASPSGGNLTLAGGVLEIGQNAAGTATLGAFTRRLGDSSDRVRWTGDGGFSAHGSNATVSLVNSSNEANGQLTWNAGSFVPTGNALLLSSDYSNAMVTLTNAINLNGGLREVRVANGSAAVDGTLAGNLTGAGSSGLVKTGAGTLNLTGTNSYSGATEIRDGALRGNVSSSSNLQLNGGVRELSDSPIALTLGTGGGQVRWTGDGGFAGIGGSRSLTLNGGADLKWGAADHTDYFVGTNNTLVFGSVSADNNVTLTNNLDLGDSGTRTIRTIHGADSAASGTLSGVVSGSADLAVTGTGRLDLTASNTNSGAVTIAGSQVRLSGSGTFADVSDLTVSHGGRLTLDDGGSAANRIKDDATVRLSGGRVDYVGISTLGWNPTSSSETVGSLQLASGSNQINVEAGIYWLFVSGTNPANLTFSTLDRVSGSGSTLEFTRSGSGTFGTNATVRFTEAPSLERGILAYAVAGDGSTPTGFATHSGNGTAITVHSGNDTAQSSWGASTIAANTADQNLNANRTVGALILGSGIDVTQTGSRTLTVETGGILSSGTSGSNISTSTLRVGGSGNRELITHVYGSGGLNISSSIQNNGNTTGLTKSGDGKLTLSGSTANTFTGTTHVNAGTLALAKSAGVTAIAGNLVVGDGGGVDTVSFFNNNQLSVSTDVTLRGGLTGAAASASNQAVLDLNGTTQTFNTLTIEGNSVIDFSGGDPCAPTFLNIADINFVGDATLTIKNWVQFTDFFLVQSTATIDFSRITFEGYGGNASWQDYSTGWKQLTPVPEPSTYGAIILGAAAGLFWFRRRRDNSRS